MRHSRNSRITMSGRLYKQALLLSFRYGDSVKPWTLLHLLVGFMVVNGG